MAALIWLAGQSWVFHILSMPLSTHLPFHTILSSPLFSLSVVPPCFLPPAHSPPPPWQLGLNLESLFYFKSPFHGVRSSEGHNRYIPSHRQPQTPRIKINKWHSEWARLLMGKKTQLCPGLHFSMVSCLSPFVHVIVSQGTSSLTRRCKISSDMPLCLSEV